MPAEKKNNNSLERYSSQVTASKVYQTIGRTDVALDAENHRKVINYIFGTRSDGPIEVTSKGNEKYRVLRLSDMGERSEK